jgi:hypothetical protein
VISEGSFTVSGIDFPDGVDPLGIWHMPAIQAIVFAPGASDVVPESDTPAMSVWHIQLPADLEEAKNIMQAQLQHVDTQNQYLDEIAAQLETLDPTIPTDTPYVIGSYAPQTVLLDSISSIRLSSPAYSTGDIAINFRSLYEQCQSLISRFQQILTPHGRIETRIGSDLVGLTKIDWTGDFETLWEARANPQAMEMHVRSTHLVSVSRLAVLRILAIAGTGALNLAIKASIPGGQFLLIPAVYNFVSDMLEELKKIPS